MTALSPDRHVTVALPGSLTRDIPHLREKTARIGLIARTLAIFRIETVLIYPDEHSDKAGREAGLLEKLLRFQETPQYLRRHLFKMDPDLQFTGTLPPLRIPSHPKPMDPRIGHVREGLVISSSRGISKIDAGYKDPVTLKAGLEINRRVTVKLTRVQSQLEGELIDPGKLRIYWGFRVRREDTQLARLIKKENPDLTLSTSHKGNDVREVMPSLISRWTISRHPLILFGSPDRGVPEILADTETSVDDVADFNLNMIPGQGVETVRTEEALIASLSILNLIDTGAAE